MGRTARSVAALLMALAAALAVPLAAPAGAAPDPLPSLPAEGYARVDRIGAGLARDPVFADPDLPGVLRGPEPAQVEAAVRDAAAELGAPVWVVVAPNPLQSESQGQNRLLARLLQERTGNGGLYIVADDRGHIDTVAFGVRRRFSALEGEYETPPKPDPLAGLGRRVIETIDRVRSLPATDTPRDHHLFGRLDPFGAEDAPLRDVEPEPGGPFFAGLLLIGPITGGVLWAGGRFVRRRRSGARAASGGGTRRPDGPARPGLRWLRRTADRELAALRTALAGAAGAGGGRGRRATAAFDAAQILFDDVASDPDRAHDLVVVIVLAREGLAALERDEPPTPPCFVNPLHGPADRRRRVRAGGENRRRYVCAACADAQQRDIGARTLQIPRPGGRRPHHSLPGPWTGAEYGARSPLAERVLTHLEVES